MKEKAQREQVAGNFTNLGEKRRRRDMTKKAKKAMAQEMNRTFEMVAETLPEQWHERLDAFFQESGAGATEMWQWGTDGSEAVDYYQVQGLYDLTNLLGGNIRVYLRGRAAKLRGQEGLRVIKIEDGFIISPVVYENDRCFRYAPPAEGEQP